MLSKELERRLLRVIAERQAMDLKAPEVSKGKINK